MRTLRMVVAGAILALTAVACNPTSPVPGATDGGAASPQPTPSAESAATTPPATLPPTPPPPTATAFSAAVLGDADGRLALSTTLTAGEVAVPGAAVTVTTTALGKTYRTITLKGIVPKAAKSIIVQLGFNNQPDTGPMKYDIKIDRITYVDGGKTKNRLPNGGFESGLYRWAVYGEGRVTTPESSFSDGRVLRLRAEPDQEIVINSFGISVTPESEYTLKVTAEVPPAGTTSGYVAAIFLKEIEIWRESIYVVGPAIADKALTTGLDGSIALDEKLPAGKYLVRIAYAGDAAHLPAVLEQEVTVP